MLSNPVEQTLSGWLNQSLCRGLAEAALEGEATFTEYNDGVTGFEAFCRDILGIHPWGKQLDIARALLEGDHAETWVRAGHGVGKTLIAACLCEWWFSVRGKSFVSTAPSGHQVRNLLWQQGIRTNRIRARRQLPGRCLENEIKVAGRPDWFGRGFSTDKPERAQGPHLDDLLIVVDEAAGIPDWLWTAVKGWMTNPGCRLLAIGNPSADRSTAFYNAFHEERGRVSTVHVSCLEAPHVSKDWIEERRREWGEESIEWITKVLGEFPPDSADKALPLSWLEAARRLWHELPYREGKLVKAAWDVAGKGADHNALVVLDDSDRIHVADYWDEPNILESAVRVFRWFLEMGDRRPEVLIVDATGQGEGAYRKLQELWELPEHFEATAGVQLVGLDYGGKTDFPVECDRKVDELYWLARRAFNPNSEASERVALPPDSLMPGGLKSAEIVAQLNTRRYSYTPKARFKIESKKELARRNARSPDVADAIVALFHVPKQTEVCMVII